MIDLLLVSQLTPLIYTSVNCSLSIMTDTQLFTGPLGGLTAVETLLHIEIVESAESCVITATGDVTPADSLRCKAVGACKLPHFFHSSVRFFILHTFPSTFPLISVPDSFSQ